jgi:hypothetical protein
MFQKYAGLPLTEDQQRNADAYQGGYFYAPVKMDGIGADFFNWLNQVGVSLGVQFAEDESAIETALNLFASVNARREAIRAAEEIRARERAAIQTPAPIPSTPIIPVLNEAPTYDNSNSGVTYSRYRDQIAAEQARIAAALQSVPAYQALTFEQLKETALAIQAQRNAEMNAQISAQQTLSGRRQLLILDSENETAPPLDLGTLNVLESARRDGHNVTLRNEKFTLDKVKL